MLAGEGLGFLEGDQVRLSPRGHVNRCSSADKLGERRLRVADHHLQPRIGERGVGPAPLDRSATDKKLKRLGVTEDFSKKIDARLEAREQQRAAKNFAESDRLRKELEAEGVLVMDGPDGVSWTLNQALS